MKRANEPEGTYKTKYPGIFKRVGRRATTYELRYKAPDTAIGKLMSRSESFKTLEEARGRQVGIQGQKAANTLVAASKETLGTYLEIYLAAKKQILRPTSFERESGVVRKHIIPRIGHMSLKEITPAHVEQFYMQLERDGVSLHTRDQVHKAMSNSMGRAARQKKIAYNVASREVLSYIPRYKRPQIQAMSDEDQAKYIEAAKKYEGTYGALFLMALYTGLRRGELLDLKWRDIDWENRTICVNATLTVVGAKLDEDEPKSRAGRRTISIAADDCVEALKAHRAAQVERRLRCSNWVDNGLVFCSDRGTPINPSNLYKAYYKFLDNARVERVNFHNLRHTNITEAMRSGVNPKAVQVHAGHSDFSMTASYAHVAVRDEHEVAEAVAAAFARKKAR